MLNMFNFEQLVAQTIQLAQTGNKVHGNTLHVWTGLLRPCYLTMLRLAIDVCAHVFRRSNIWSLKLFFCHCLIVLVSFFNFVYISAPADFRSV